LTQDKFEIFEILSNSFSGKVVNGSVFFLEGVLYIVELFKPKIMTIERTISDWIYKYDSAENKFEVIPNIKIQKPKTLFKYYPLNENAVDSLFHNYIFASHPDHFNDLYDCYFEIIEPTNEYLFYEMDKIQNHIINRERFKEDANEFIKSFKLHFRAAMFRFYGIFSLTTCNKNILMWAHYSNNEGFAVEFDYSRFPFDFDGPFNINYKSSFKKVILKSDPDKRIATNYMCNIKDEKWKYEKEWRIIIKTSEKQQFFSPKIQMYKDLGGHNRKFSYPKDAIKSISLANHFFEIEEVYWLNQMTIKIELIHNEKFEMKKTVLDFLCLNHIQTKIIVRNNVVNSFGLNLRSGNLECLKDKSYQFKVDNINFKNYLLS